MYMFTGQVTWGYEPGDWILSPSWAGLIDHHMRITDRLIDANLVRWYQVFDTTVARGFADYEWILADRLETESKLVNRPDPQHVPTVLARAAQCRYLPYSIPARTDCESLQRWIHSGLEQFRWSGQVWTGIAAFVGAVIVAAVTADHKSKRRRRRR